MRKISSRMISLFLLVSVTLVSVTFLPHSICSHVTTSTDGRPHHSLCKMTRFSSTYTSKNQDCEPVPLFVNGCRGKCYSESHVQSTAAATADRRHFHPQVKQCKCCHPFEYEWSYVVIKCPRSKKKIQLEKIRQVAKCRCQKCVV